MRTEEAVEFVGAKARGDEAKIRIYFSYDLLPASVLAQILQHLDDAYNALNAPRSEVGYAIGFGPELEKPKVGQPIASTVFRVFPKSRLQVGLADL